VSPFTTAINGDTMFIFGGGREPLLTVVRPKMNIMSLSQSAATFTAAVAPSPNPQKPTRPNHILDRATPPSRYCHLWLGA